MNLKRIYCGIFILLIYGWMILTFIALGEKIADRYVHSGWNAEEEYPFTERKALQTEHNTVSRSILENITEKLEHAENAVDHMLKMYNPGYQKMVLFKRAWDRFVFQFDLATSMNLKPDEYEGVDRVVQYQNGELAYLIDDEDISEELHKVSAFGQEIKEEGRNFLYFESPCKIGELDESYLYHGEYKDHAYEKIAEVLGTLRKDGLDVLSMTEIIDTEHLNRDALFFRTDHHWLPQTGLWACTYLGDWMNKKYGYNVDLGIFDEANYDVESYEYPILGSPGYKVTHFYSEPETFPIILPKYDSELEVFNSAYGETTAGTIEETLFDWDILNDTGLYSNKVKYGVYGYGYEGLLQIHNMRKHDGKRVLLIKESFADCMTPWLSNLAEYVDVMDMRYFTGSKRTYIEKTNPDTVIVLCGVLGYLGEIELD